MVIHAMAYSTNTYFIKQAMIPLSSNGFSRVPIPCHNSGEDINVLIHDS